MLQPVFQTWICIFLCVSFCIVSHPPLVMALGQTYELQLVHRRQDTVLASFPVQPGQKFSLHYIHSSDHTPVVAVFQVTAGSRIVLVEEKYAWYGAGLAFHPRNKIGTSQGWTRVQLQRAMDPFHLRVGRVANHTLCIAQTTLSLKDIAAGGTSLWIRVRPKGELSHE